MELLNVEDVAKIFAVKPHTVRNWIRRKQIPPELILKIGATVRIRKSGLDAFISKPAC